MPRSVACMGEVVVSFFPIHASQLARAIRLTDRKKEVGVQRHSHCIMCGANALRLRCNEENWGDYFD